MTESTKTNSDDGHPQPVKKKRKANGFFILALVFIAIFLFSKHESVTTVDCTPEIIANKPDVVMLGAWWCTYCYQAKKYFQHNDINYCEYDMESTTIGKQLYEENGGGAVPILLIGKYRLQGFNEHQIEQALALLNESTNNPQ